MPETIEVEIEDMGGRGVGIGFAKDGRHKSRLIFVPYTIPGEVVLAQPSRIQETLIRAEGVRLIEASADRVYPVCPHFGLHQCGLCQWQHIDYAAQVLIKQDVLATQLERGGVKNPPVRAVIPSPLEWGYNHHMTFMVSGEADNLYLGFASSDDDGRIIPIKACHVLNPDLLALYEQLDLELKGLRRVKMQIGTDGAEMLILTALEDDAPELKTDLTVSVNLILPNNEPMNLIGDSHSRYDITAAGIARTFRVTAGSYFRANVAALPNLIAAVIGLLDVKPSESVLDLYAGVGVFSAYLAPLASLVTLVESYPPAVTDADENLSDFENVDVIEGGVDVVISELDEKYAAAVVDPGSRGLGNETIRGLGALGVKRIAYVSGEAETLARDAKRLAQAGYALKMVQPIDLAPQTYYTDIVGLFDKK